MSNCLLYRVAPSMEMEYQNVRVLKIFSTPQSLQRVYDRTIDGRDCKSKSLHEDSLEIFDPTYPVFFSLIRSGVASVPHCSMILDGAIVRVNDYSGGFTSTVESILLSELMGYLEINWDKGVYYSVSDLVAKAYQSHCNKIDEIRRQVQAEARF